MYYVLGSFLHMSLNELEKPEPVFLGEKEAL